MPYPSDSVRIEQLSLENERVFGVYEDELEVHHIIMFDIDGLPPDTALATG
jgi:hypothetical protein